MKKEIKVLFVCVGNICRSPMAEVIFRNLAKKHGRTDIIVKSAGTYAHESSDMTDKSRQALLHCGEKLPKKPHKSTQFTHEMNNKFDHVIDLREFADPWMGTIENYIDVCKQLQKYCEELYNKICKI